MFSARCAAKGCTPRWRTPRLRPPARGHENSQHHVHRCRLHRGRVNHVVREQPCDEERNAAHIHGPAPHGCQSSAPRFTQGSPPASPLRQSARRSMARPCRLSFLSLIGGTSGGPFVCSPLFPIPPYHWQDVPSGPVSFNKTISILVFQFSGINATSTPKWSIFRQHTRVFSTISTLNWHLACHFGVKVAFTAKKGSMGDGVGYGRAARAS